MTQICEPGGADLSEPLNQEDLLATLGTFTTVVFRALDKLAVPFDEEHRKAYYHLWNIVGWHLGIGDDDALAPVPTGLSDRWPNNSILPLEVNEMDTLFERLRTLLKGRPSRAGASPRRSCRTSRTRCLDRCRGHPVHRPLSHRRRRGRQVGHHRWRICRACGESHGRLERLAQQTRMSVFGEYVLSAVAQMLTRYALRNFVTRSWESTRGFTIDPHTASRWGVETGPELLIQESRARL